MKVLFIGLAVLATAYCEISQEYIPPVEESAIGHPSNEYLAPLADSAAGAVLSDDGYLYKTIRRLRHRNRRDVSELPLPEYLPPAAEAPLELPSEEYLSPLLADSIPEGASADGYHYQTVRRLKYRQRRDVSELPAAEYLPPALSAPLEIPSNEYLAPLESAELGGEIAGTSLLDDGYRYKTVRRLRLRHRRDVSELPQAEYLPPAEELHFEAPSSEYLAPLAAAEPIPELSALADDGYRYKTVRRLRLRHRRDVSELPSAEYLPPTEFFSASPVADIPVISNEYIAPVEQDENILADDGYRYKTVKRYKIRRT